MEKTYGINWVLNGIERSSLPYCMQNVLALQLQLNEVSSGQ